MLSNVTRKEGALHMRTWEFHFKDKRSVLWAYFSRNTADTRAMRNVANFYIRNTMTGLCKSPGGTHPCGDGSHA